MGDLGKESGMGAGRSIMAPSPEPARRVLSTQLDLVRPGRELSWMAGCETLPHFTDKELRQHMHSIG